VISSDGRQYRLDVSYRILEQGIPRDNLNCRLQVTIDAYPPDKRRLLDAIVAADVIEDDSLIDALSITRHEACEDGKVIVRIRPYAKAM
jgi:Holliday junction resolvase RusA-like endonuclease